MKSQSTSVTVDASLTNTPPPNAATQSRISDPTMWAPVVFCTRTAPPPPLPARLLRNGLRLQTAALV